jgi:hypothetical protein
MAHFNTSLSLAERINNEEIELVSLYEKYRIELISRSVSINNFYANMTNVLVNNQSLILNCSHLAYKYYQYIVTYCTTSYSMFSYKNDFINKLNSLKNRNFQKIVKIMGQIALHKLENGEIDYYYIFNEIYDKNPLYEKLILKILKQMKNEKE